MGLNSSTQSIFLPVFSFAEIPGQRLQLVHRSDKVTRFSPKYLGEIFVPVLAELIPEGQLFFEPDNLF